MARKAVRKAKLSPAPQRKLYSDNCPQKYTGPIEDADGTRPFNGFLWPTESWWASHEQGKRHWDSRWHMGIVALWDGTYAVDGSIWKIEKNNRRYSWTEQPDQLPRPNIFPTRRQAIRTAAADLLRQVRSARTWPGHLVRCRPEHFSEVVNWILATAYREAEAAEPVRLVRYEPPPPPPPPPTGLPILDFLSGVEPAPQLQQA